MPRHWRAPFSFLLSVVILPLCTSAANSFENTAIVRTVELGGALVHVTTTYAVKALEDGSSVYTIALAEQEHAHTSWLEAKLKGESERLPLEDFGFHQDSGVFLYTIELPKALNTNQTANLVIETVQTHATYPWPEEAGQKDGQSLKYEAELLVLSPYKTAVQRTKVRSPSPQIHSYTTPEDVEFTTDAVATKSGATITYGPFHDIPPSATSDFADKKQKHITVHYSYDYPVLEVTKLERAAEVSHWGANLNIEDKYWLHNAGPRLKGHFSRLEYQTQNYFGRPAPHTIPALQLHLPAGIHDAYYYDLVGNVSTSHLRTTPSIPKGAAPNQYSVLELRPRYPIVGGWNYSFTLGWDSPLEDYAGYDKATGKYVVSVPIMTVIPGSVVDEAEVKIVLPEGATDIEYFVPYPALDETISTHISYLDTVGRPKITLKYAQLTDKHGGNIYVTYKVPFSAHMKKPVAVTTAFAGIFTLALAWKRVDFRIRRK
ncbi:oligosaccharyl transferase alpha subunit [Lentinus tigrinus ALCF2SS1-7]|uniref:Dolichyl-diphosphooligosaccharide--protein glycosyltransferase subunit 1 n=1 Tax=Lentinus tigrinus ALCF2SS1-6 TaxID=1328759 RepID=A0A5C2STW6_9APHY|nr:oligosaccharyl transferase alpha subunit [Lentinus tigrinus ALCF2SS1-6]RPD81242.1 oligosaccharyl transferase alpha subunit [Lentinus tigrinus ALCF2SS1-7]